MANSLLITKLHVPSVRSPLIQRDRLLEKLDQGLTCKLILISAAAGFGKTTVLSAWAQQTQLSVSWLALDQRDNDEKRFWTYVIAALQTVDKTVGEATLSILQSAEAAAFETFLTPLLNELSLIEPLTERELEVLNYLAKGMTNQTIADQLFVSLAAVKWPARNIYGKLEVNNRTQAVAKARELSLLL
ncbi:MAG: LuxR C-terminal-related transcriptional regulator [Phormidesmis sp.]